MTESTELNKLVRHDPQGYPVIQRDWPEEAHRDVQIRYTKSKRTGRLAGATIICSAGGSLYRLSCWQAITSRSCCSMSHAEWVTAI